MIPCVGYNIDMIPTAPDAALTSATINWGPYYTYAVQSVIDGTAIETDWAKGVKDGADAITELNDKTVAEGTKEAVEEAQKGIEDGTLHVFDTSKFTVGGKTLEELVESGDKDATKLKDYIKDGYFHESDVESGMPSAPAFTFIIDGINSITK